MQESCNDSLISDVFKEEIISPVQDTNLYADLKKALLTSCKCL